MEIACHRISMDNSTTNLRKEKPMAEEERIIDINTDDELDDLFIDDDIGLPEEEHVEPIVLKMKPVYNYQSVEFDFAIRSADDLDEAFELYEKILDRLIDIAPEQPTANQSRKPAVELMTEKQKEICDKFGIPYKKTTTKAEAQALIADSCNK